MNAEVVGEMALLCSSKVAIITTIRFIASVTTQMDFETIFTPRGIVAIVAAKDPLGPTCLKCAICRRILIFGGICAALFAAYHLFAWMAHTVR